MTIERLGQTYLDINGTVDEQKDVMSFIKDEVGQALIFSSPPQTTNQHPYADHIKAPIPLRQKGQRS